jgi:hypothetical protein
MQKDLDYSTSITNSTTRYLFLKDLHVGSKVTYY